MLWNLKLKGRIAVYSESTKSLGLFKAPRVKSFTMDSNMGFLITLVRWFIMILMELSQELLLISI